jgi:tRNA-splicing ligase RtcB
MQKQKIQKDDLIKIHNSLYEIPKSFRENMHISGRVLVNDIMLKDVLLDDSLIQVVNMATLPGI